MTEKTCKHCGISLILKQTRRTAEQLKKQYYFSAYYSCPRCGRMYLDEKFKVTNENNGLFASKTLSSEPVDIEIWTDGACVNNGNEKAKAAWAFVSGKKESAGLVAGKQTNNRAEAEAIYQALKWAGEVGYRKVKILADTQITIHSLRKPLAMIKANTDIFENIFRVIKEHKLEVVYEKVLGHSGVAQNERVDKLANGLASK